jgi:hypothetical protein
MALFDSKGGVKSDDIGTSSRKHIEAGSGSRPSQARYKIETSSPEDARTLDKAGSVEWLGRSEHKSGRRSDSGG